MGPTGDRVLPAKTRATAALASTLTPRLGVSDTVVQRLLRHSSVTTTRNHSIKSVPGDSVVAMSKLSEVFSSCSLNGDSEALAVVQ